MRLDPYKRDSTKYCKFHKEHKHDIEDYFKLKEEMENLICKELIRQFVARLEGCIGQQVDCQP